MMGSATVTPELAAGLRQHGWAWLALTLGLDPNDPATWDLLQSMNQGLDPRLANPSDTIYFPGEAPAGSVLAPTAAPAGPADYAYATDLLRAAEPYMLQPERSALQREEMVSATQRALIAAGASTESARIAAASAWDRLQQELNLEQAKLYGSGQLRDTIAARYWARGEGPQPGIVPIAQQTPSASYYGGAGTAAPTAPPLAAAPPLATPIAAPGPVAAAQTLAAPNVPAQLYAQGRTGGQLFRDPGFTQPFTGLAGGGTLRPGQGALVGEGGPEVLVRRPSGQMEVIPIKAQYQLGGNLDIGNLMTPLQLQEVMRSLDEAARSAGQAASKVPAGQRIGSPADLGGGAVTIPLLGGGQEVTAPGSAAGAPALDWQNIPALRAIRGEEPYYTPGFQAYGPGMGLPEIGGRDVLAPYQSAFYFLGRNPLEQQDIIDYWRAAGIDPTLAFSEMRRSTPGYRELPGRLYSI